MGLGLDEDRIDPGEVGRPDVGVELVADQHGGLAGDAHAREGAREGERERLDQRLALAAALQEDGTRPLISITYFIPDAKKSGGAFSTASGRIFKIDAYARQLILEDPEGNRIPVPLEQVLEIEGEVFSKADPFCE